MLTKIPFQEWCRSGNNSGERKTHSRCAPYIVDDPGENIPGGPSWLLPLLQYGVARGRCYGWFLQPSLVRINSIDSCFGWLTNAKSLSKCSAFTNAGFLAHSAKFAR